MLEAHGVLPLGQLLGALVLLDVPRQQITEQVLPHLRLLLNEQFLLDAKEAVSLHLGPNEPFDQTMNAH